MPYYWSMLVLKLDHVIKRDSWCPSSHKRCTRPDLLSAFKLTSENYVITSKHSISGIAGKWYSGGYWKYIDGFWLFLSRWTHSSLWQLWNSHCHSNDVMHSMGLPWGSHLFEKCRKTMHKNGANNYILNVRWEQISQPDLGLKTIPMATEI